MHGTTLDIRANIFGDDFDLQLKFILNKRFKLIWNFGYNKSICCFSNITLETGAKIILGPIWMRKLYDFTRS